MRLSAAYKKKGFPIITILLSILCLAVSILTFYKPILYNFLALWTNQLRPWQLLSFLFENPVVPQTVLWLHLIHQLIPFLTFGILCEKLMGKLRTLAVFMVEWIITIGIILILSGGRYSSFAGITSITYAYAAIAFVYFIMIWRENRRKIFAQLLTYFFIIEFLCLVIMLNPFVFGRINVISNLSGIAVGMIFGMCNRKELVVK